MRSPLDRRKGETITLLGSHLYSCRQRSPQGAIFTFMVRLISVWFVISLIISDGEAEAFSIFDKISAGRWSPAADLVKHMIFLGKSNFTVGTYLSRPTITLFVPFFEELE